MSSPGDDGIALRCAAMRWLVGILGVAGLVAVLAVALSLAGMRQDEAGPFLWRDAAVEPRPVTALRGAALGESFEGLAGRLGPFDADTAPRADIDPERDRGYVQRGGPLRLLVRDGRVLRVSYECGPGDGTRVNRVGCGDPQERVVEVFGNGARRLCAKVAAADPRASMAPRAFAFDVPDTGTRYIAIDGAVQGFVVMGPQDLDAALGGGSLWHRCG